MLVSVIIPVYNRQDTIKEAIDSILEQSYKNLEIVVVDDCSKDQTVETVKAISDSRVRLIESDKNGGACVARNIGIDNAKGEIIAFQDSDDVWHTDKLQKSLAHMQEQNADFVFSAVFRYGEKGYSEEVRIVPSYNLNLEPSKLTKLLYLNCVSTQTIVAKREVFGDIRFDSRLPRFQDWDIAIQVVKNGYNVYYIDEPLVDCYVLGDSITSDDKKAADAMLIFEEKYKDDLERDRAAYHGFFERAAYRYEAAGMNGSRCFLNAYKSGKSITLLVQYVLAKLRLYGVFGRVKAAFTKDKGEKHG